MTSTMVKGAPSKASVKEEAEDTFDWVELKRQIDSDPERADGGVRKEHETQMGKLRRKFSENPIIPIGTILTTVCLSIGLVSFASKRSRMSQLMMRGRIMAQGFTVVGLVGGILYGLGKK